MVASGQRQRQPLCWIAVCILALFAVATHATSDALAAWKSGFDAAVKDFNLQPSDSGLAALTTQVGKLRAVAAASSGGDKLAALTVYFSAKRDLVAIKSAFLKGDDAKGQVAALHASVGTKLSPIIGKSPIVATGWTDKAGTIETVKDSWTSKLGALTAEKHLKAESFKCKLAAVFGKSLAGCSVPPPVALPPPPAVAPPAPGVY